MKGGFSLKTWWAGLAILWWGNHILTKFSAFYFVIEHFDAVTINIKIKALPGLIRRTLSHSKLIKNRLMFLQCMCVKSQKYSYNVTHLTVIYQSEFVFYQLNWSKLQERTLKCWSERKATKTNIYSISLLSGEVYKDTSWFHVLYEPSSLLVFDCYRLIVLCENRFILLLCPKSVYCVSEIIWADLINIFPCELFGLYKKE